MFSNTELVDIACATIVTTMHLITTTIALIVLWYEVKNHRALSNKK